MAVDFGDMLWLAVRSDRPAWCDNVFDFFGGEQYKDSTLSTCYKSLCQFLKQTSEPNDPYNLANKLRFWGLYTNCQLKRAQVFTLLA